jgi:hypothetical protein
MNALEKGIYNINYTVKNFGYDKKLSIFIESLKNFSDVLHCTVIAKHFRNTFRKHMVVMGISDKYSDSFDIFANRAAVVVVPMPHEATKEDRIKWIEHCKQIGFARVITPLFGNNDKKCIIDNIISNAGIKNLSVIKRPLLPHDVSDYRWNDNFLRNHNLAKTPYVFLEYRNSNSKNIWPIEKYESLIKKINHPVIYTGSLDDPKLSVGIDARGCTWRQAKVFIERSSYFIGCGGDINVLACCEGLKTSIIEVNVGNSLSAKSNYGIKVMSISIQNEDDVCKIVNKH